MPFIRDSFRLAAPFAGVLLAAWASAPAQAQDASDWAPDLRSAVRLIIASAPRGAAQFRAGVELRLDPGWHTYWRYPGDSGVPPNFDFSGSENLRTAKLLYPAPKAFTDEAGTSIGYSDRVIFPLRITPRDPTKPVRLKVGVSYAVCEKLCVPASGHPEVTLKPRQASGFDDRIAAAEASVPKQVLAQAAGLTAKRVSGGPKPLVYVDVATDNAIQIFAEGPSAEWALPIPKPAPGAPPGHRHFGFELDGLPPGVDPKGPLELTFTIVGGDRPIETTTHLD